MPTAWQQSAFRISRDDGGETSATYAYALNTNGNWWHGTNFRLRFVVGETGTTAATLTPTLYYSRNGGAYTRVNSTSSVVRPSASPYFVDGDPTTRASNPRALGAQTFVAGSMDEVDGACATTASISRNKETEVEFCLTFQAADITPGDTVAFRVYNSTTALNTYTNTPTITVDIISGTANTTFTHSQSGVATLGMLATAALAFGMAISATGAQEVTGTADCSFSSTLASHMDVGEYTGTANLSYGMSISATATGGQTGYRSHFAHWIGGAGASTPTANATANLTFSSSMDAAGTAIYGEAGPRSHLAFWVGGAAQAADRTATAALSYGFSIQADQQEGARGGIRSPLAFWMGGAETNPGLIGDVTGDASLTFTHQISAVYLAAIDGVSGGEEFTLLWDPNTEPDLAGYKLYYSTTSGSGYTLLTTLGIVTTYTVSNFLPGGYYFVVTAFNSLGQESSYSNEVYVTVSGLAFSSSLSAAATSVAVDTGTANLTFTHSQSATAAESIPATANLSFTFSTASTGTHYFNATGTSNLTFTSSLASTASTTTTGTADLTFLPIINSTATAGFIAETANLTFTFSTESYETIPAVTATSNCIFTMALAATAAESVTSSSNLTFTSSLAAASAESNTATGNLTFAIGLGGSGKPAYNATTSLTFSPHVNTEATAQGLNVGTSNLSFGFGLSAASITYENVTGTANLTFTFLMRARYTGGADSSGTANVVGPHIYEDYPGTIGVG